MSTITVLSKTEEKSLYSLKELNYKEKAHFLQILATLLEKVLSFELEDGKVTFILMYGYFKVFHQFYDTFEYIQSDLDYVSKKYELPHTYDIHETVNYIYRKCENSIQTSQSHFQHRLRQIQTVSRFCYLENIEPNKSIHYLELAMLNVKYGSKSRQVYKNHKAINKV